MQITNEKTNLNEIRVIDDRIVFITGLPSPLSDLNILKTNEFLGQYGNIEKISIN